MQDISKQKFSDLENLILGSLTEKKAIHIQRIIDAQSKIYDLGPRCPDYCQAQEILWQLYHYIAREKESHEHGLVMYPIFKGAFLREVFDTINPSSYLPGSDNDTEESDFETYQNLMSF